MTWRYGSTRWQLEGGGHENTSEKAFRISGGGARGGRKKKEEEQATASGARCGGSKLIAGTVFAAQSFATWPTAAAAAQPDATGGSGRGIPTIPVLFEPKRGGRCTGVMSKRGPLT